MSKLRMGVIGLGMGRGHMKAYLADPRCEVVALCDMNAEALKAVADEHGVKGRYTDAAAMFAEAKLDAVSIAVPNKFHAPLTLQALAAGAHVLCEKPMAMTVAEAQSMQAAADKAGRNLMINLSYRFSNMSHALKQQVDAGVVGQIYFGRTVWHRRRGMPKFGGWFGQKDLAGGGPLIDLGVHRIDLALWLMGHPEPISVCGSTYNVIAAEKAKREDKVFTVEDLAAGIVKFANGATLMVEASWALNINENEHMITSLYGDKGGLVQKNRNGTYDFTAEVYTEEGGNHYTKVLDRADVPAPSSYREFVSSIVEKRSPMATGHDGIRVQKILEGLYRSAAEGREIRFD
jgi:predicted dehydrogenase